MVLQMLWWSASDDYTMPQEISMMAVDAAIRFMDDYFVPMAERAFGENALGESDALASLLPYPFECYYAARVRDS